MRYLENQPIQIDETTIIHRNVACVTVLADVEEGTIFEDNDFLIVTRPYNFRNPVPFTIKEEIVEESTIEVALADFYTSTQPYVERFKQDRHY